MARDNVFDYFDLDKSDPDSIEELMDIAQGKRSDDPYGLMELSDEEFLKFFEEIDNGKN